MATPRILVFAGTTREASFNKKLARAAVPFIEAAGGQATFADLRDYPMPLYDGDLEAASGKPEPAKAWKQLMVEHDGFLVATAEYNRTITGVLKNAIDWASRADDDDPRPVPAFRGKVVGLVSASPGAMGGLRALYHVRDIFTALGCLVLPEQFAMGGAAKAFNEDGTLADEKNAQKVESIASNLVSAISKLS